MKESRLYEAVEFMLSNLDEPPRAVCDYLKVDSQELVIWMYVFRDELFPAIDVVVKGADSNTYTKNREVQNNG